MLYGVLLGPTNGALWLRFALWKALTYGNLTVLGYYVWELYSLLSPTSLAC